MVYLPTGGARAGTITYDPETKTVHTRGFPETSPATFDDLSAAEREHGWGVIAYDRETDTWNVAASLHIGCDTDLGTFVQIGREKHPAETVVVHGDVWIRPPKKSAQRSDGRAAIVNRLTIGDPEDESIRATLKIACSRPREYGIYIGFREGKTMVSGGDLHVYNSMITAADPEHRLRGFTFQTRTGWYAHEVRLINAHISRIGDLAMYGIMTAEQSRTRIEGTTFEHCGVLLSGFRHYVRNSIFISNQVVLAVGGPGAMIGCTLDGNVNDWSYGGGKSATELQLIDCVFETGEPNGVLRKNTVTPDEMARTRVPLYPVVNDYRTLPVLVTDRRARPVALAAVSVSCPEDRENIAVRNGYALTDTRGLTPDNPERAAMMILRRRFQATDDPEQPTVSFYDRYLVEVRATGYQTQRVDIDPAETLPRPLHIKLQRDRRGIGGCIGSASR